jgi:ribonuclease J
MVQTLPQPAPLKPGVLRIIPLGGIGEIGRNMTVFEIDSKLLIVDCGVLFPEEHQPGIDVILPDFGYIRDRMDDVLAIVLTHGHEDHIGGVPYLLRLREDIPIIGSALTLAFLEAKLKEHRITPNVMVTAEGQTKKGNQGRSRKQGVQEGRDRQRESLLPKRGQGQRQRRGQNQGRDRQTM